jgi:hypothetical protein
MKIDKADLRVISLAVAVLLFPILWILVLLVWKDAADAGNLFATAIVPLLVSIAAFFFILRKSGACIEKLRFLCRKLPAPLVSSIRFAAVGAGVVSAGMTIVILFLGHARPVNWNFDAIPAAAGVAFIACFVIGFAVGALRRQG